MAATALFAWLLLRFGLLALATCYSVSMSITGLPLSLNWSSWYSGQTVASFALLTAAAVAAFGAATFTVRTRRAADSGAFRDQVPP